MINRSLSFARLRPLRQHALFLSLQSNTHQYAFGRFPQRNYAIRARLAKVSRRVVNCHSEHLLRYENIRSGGGFANSKKLIAGKAND